MHLISPYSIAAKSNIKVMKIKEMAANESSWLLQRFFSKTWICLEKILFFRYFNFEFFTYKN